VPAALLWPLLCAGCGTTAPVTVQPDIPAAMLMCQPEPDPPAAQTDSGVAGYIVALAGAGRDCRDRLHAVAGILSAVEK
jgi:hypothetical protein